MANKYTYTFYKGISSQKRGYFSNISIKDITSGLMSIETIFEARVIPNTYIIPIKLSLLNNISFSYEETMLNYL